VERSIGAISGIIVKLLKGVNDDWVVYLPFAQCAYNNKIRAATGTTPFSVMFGRAMNGFLPYDDVELEEFVDIWCKRLNNMLSLVWPSIYEKTKAMKEKQKDDFAKRHRMFQAGSFPPGARVWVLDETRKGKTEPVYQGPYQVVQRTSGGSYVLKDQNGIIGRNVPIHLLKLQKKKGMPDISDESLYFVNKIHQHRGIAGKREYLVEWKGIKNKTWEPEQNMVDYEVVRNYWRRVKKQDVKDKESMSPVRGV
jgi:hypothetical protein